MKMKTPLYRQCARMVMVGFEGPAAGAEALSLVDDGVFGVILFSNKKNLGTPEEISSLCRSLKTHAARPFVLAVDQEGGRVARLRGGPFTTLPTLRALGDLGDEARAERVGRLLAHELRAVGFDWDFAPVLDVDTNPKNPVIGDRSFSRDPAEVARLGLALARGLEAGGVASCGKHFPGHGDTHQDSHFTLPVLEHGLARLRSTELVPFGAYAKAKLAALMTAHVIFEAVDPGVPATMSRKVLSGVLRKELGFEGVVVSDDLEMKAIAERYDLGEVAVLGAAAGVDLFLVCHRADRQRAVIEALVRAVESGRLPLSRVEEANARLDALSARFAHPPEDRLATLGTPEHQALRAGLSAAAAGPDPTEPRARPG
ncbi:MAG: beta-N-acetylhexosaminidase [Myxococcaceae bacterium]